MAIRPPDRIFDDIVQKKGKGAPIRRQLTAGKQRNWLLALTLHSFAKHAEGAPLTDLEQSIVSAYRKNGITDAEIKQQGLATKRLPAAVRKEIYPGRFAELHTGSAYSFKDLKKDAPGLTRSFLAMPNVATIDVDAVHAGQATLADFQLAGRGVRREYGGEALVALAPNVDTAARAAARYTIKATKFRCNDRAGDSIFGPSNEAYWIFGAVGDSAPDKARTTRSQVFGDVDSGESRTFAAQDGIVWGPSGVAQELPDGEVGVLIQLWEHDEGDPKRAQDVVKAAFATAAGILAATGVAAWVGAVVAGVGAVIHLLLGFMDDDHIADQVFAITRKTIEDQIKKAGQSFEVVKRFDDGDADYSLTVKVSRVA